MSDDIGLLLAHFDNDEPFLKEGIPLDQAANNPKPKEAEGPDHYDYEGGDQNSLVEQRWGIVAPEGPAGDRLLALVAPLQKRREEQMGIDSGKTWIRRVPADMDDSAADDWIAQVWKDEDTPKMDRPHYLMVLGDADLVSWELHKKLTANTYAGRLAFPDDGGYEAYVAKVLASEKEKAAAGARALFYCVHGDPATDAGYQGLLQPTIEIAHENQKNGAFNAKQIVEVGDGANVSVDDLLQAAGERQPTMMFTVSHGAGTPRAGWGSLKQTDFQGAMSLGGGNKITYDMVTNRPFVPNGIWFFFACFGAGTPASSSYDIWLDQLKGIGKYSGAIADLARSLPQKDKGEKPFVARLPQAALANPDGPLAVMGHVDLAWTYGFQDIGPGGKQNRTSRFTDVFRSLVDGKRAGLGLNALQSTFNTTSSSLNTIYSQEERARKKNLPVSTDKASVMKKANLWMLREDLSAYVLLGDPAASLNIEPQGAGAVVSAAASVSLSSVAAAAAPAPAPAAVQAFSAPVAQQVSIVKKLPDVKAMEAAILPVLTEDTTVKKVAEKLGVERDDVQAWVTAYQNAGRDALKKL